MDTRLPPRDRSLEELIETIPALAGRGWSIEQLSDGLTNRSWLLSGTEERLVLRQNQPAPGVDRQREAQILKRLGMHGLAPLVIDCNPTAGYLLTAFIDRPRWSQDDVRSSARLTLLGRYLRALHQLSTESIAVFDLDAQLKAYFANTKVSALPEFPRLQAASNNLRAQLHHAGWYEQRPSICHHDLNYANLFGDITLIAIDWEYAAVGNPLLDLGMFISYHELGADEAAPLIESYFGALLPDVIRQITLATRLAQLLELLWLAAQTGLSESSKARLKQLLLVWG